MSTGIDELAFAVLRLGPVEDEDIASLCIDSDYLAAVAAERMNAITTENARLKAALESERKALGQAGRENARLREALLNEAEYSYGYARKYAETDAERSKRHRDRGDRLKRAALEGGGRP